MQLLQIIKQICPLQLKSSSITRNKYQKKKKNKLRYIILF